MKTEKFISAFLVLFLVLFFGTIINNGIESKKETKAFGIACKAKDGLPVHISTGRGWGRNECRAPSAFIDIKEP